MTWYNDPVIIRAIIVLVCVVLWYTLQGRRGGGR
jgi:hypothetical protein